MHYSRLSKVVIDVPAGDHDQALAFWRGATGTPMKQFSRHPEYHGSELVEGHFGLLLQRLEEGPARIHLDIHTDNMEAELARLERLGAKREREVNGWWIMRDPAGLPFCVIRDQPGTLDDSNAQRWD